MIFIIFMIFMIFMILWFYENWVIYHKRRLLPTGKKTVSLDDDDDCLMWAGAAEKPKQSKMIFKNHQNDSKQLTELPSQF